MGTYKTPKHLYDIGIVLCPQCGGKMTLELQYCYRCDEDMERKVMFKSSIDKSPVEEVTCLEVRVRNNKGTFFYYSEDINTKKHLLIEKLRERGYRTSYGRIAIVKINKVLLDKFNLSKVLRNED